MRLKKQLAEVVKVTVQLTTKLLNLNLEVSSDSSKQQSPTARVMELEKPDLVKMSQEVPVMGDDNLYVK